MDAVHSPSRGPDNLIRVADLRVKLAQILRTEFIDSNSAIVQVRIEDQVFTRGLSGVQLEAFQKDLSAVALDAPPPVA